MEPPVVAAAAGPAARRPREHPPDVQVGDGAVDRPTDPSRPLRLRVAWGDYTQVPGDIHVTGHHQGVVPAAAEAALDRAV